MAAKALPTHDEIDPKTGFCTSTRTFHSLRPRFELPPLDQPLSAATFAIHRLLSRLPCDDRSSTAAIIDSDTGYRLSFADFLNQVRSLAASLRWLSKGSVAFVLAPNSPQVPVLFFALLSIGVVVSPADPLGTPADVSRRVQLSRPAVAFATTATAHKLPSSLSIPIFLLHTQHFDDEMHAGNLSGDIPDVRIMQSDAAAILYSSGTTGHVKGVVLTHRNLIATLALFWSATQERPSPPHAHVDLLSMLFFHTAGFFKSLSSLAVGETMVVMEQFDLGKALKSVEEYKATRLFVGAPVVVAMATVVAGAAFDLSSLQVVIYGGSSVAAKFLTMFHDRFPWVKLLHGYGITEAGPISAQLITELKVPYQVSVGALAPNLEAKVVDTVAGRALFPGQSGELWLRGPTIMQGYVGDEAATGAVLDSEGWLRTGDVCYFDENGLIHVVDRLKEMIKCQGYQVPPAELEQLLLNHPEIVDAAVIPYPDDEAIQIPMAFVVRAPASTLDHGKVMDFTAKHVVPYKRIRKVAFVEAIPKNATGKVLRKELIKMADFEVLFQS